VKHPLFVNMLIGGITPILWVKRLEQLGYKVVVCARAMHELRDAWKNAGRMESWLRRR
jgi:2-methylisocitrate lyase-like PEP mutase family enzyme